MTKKRLEKLGGFDERFKGFGAGDTDFALSIRESGFYLFLSEAVVYHQQHPVYSPPLNHFDSIIRNSSYFYGKWKMWPLTTYLQQFTDLGLIKWTDYCKNIEVIARPNISMLRKSQKNKAAFF